MSPTNDEQWRGNVWRHHGAPRPCIAFRRAASSARREHRRDDRRLVTDRDCFEVMDTLQAAGVPASASFDTIEFFGDRISAREGSTNASSSMTEPSVCFRACRGAGVTTRSSSRGMHPASGRIQTASCAASPACRSPTRVRCVSRERSVPASRPPRSEFAASIEEISSSSGAVPGESQLRRRAWCSDCVVRLAILRSRT